MSTWLDIWLRTWQAWLVGLRLHSQYSGETFRSLLLRQYHQTLGNLKWFQSQRFQSASVLACAATNACRAPVILTRQQSKIFAAQVTLLSLAVGVLETAAPDTIEV